jgi:hypothetical protein
MHVKMSIRHALALAAFAALWILPAALFADTPATTQWVVTSAKASGGGNDYVTSLRIVNPNATAAEVDLYFLPYSSLDASNSALGDNSGASKVVVTVPGNSTLALDDVLATEFGATGSGGIRVEAPGTDAGGRPLAVWVLSQTLVVNAKSSTGVSGTNGFAIPSQSQDQLVALGETAYVPYISASPTSTSGYRTNLFLLSANNSANTVVDVTLRKSDGTSAGTKTLTLGKLSQTQINGIANFFGYTPAASDTNMTALVTVTSGGPVATGASVIDNAIGSISYSPPVKIPVANNGAYGLILNDGYGFSGRAEIFAGAFDYFSAGVVIPSCAGQPTLFFVQGIGTPGDPNQNATFTKNADGSTSFAGKMKDSSNATLATFSGTILTNFDGTIYGTLTYTRGAAPAGNPCPAATVTFPFSGSKGAVLP